MGFQWEENRPRGAPGPMLEVAPGAAAAVLAAAGARGGLSDADHAA